MIIILNAFDCCATPTLILRVQRDSNILFCLVSGDGAGVGKGRTIAGLILENFLQGRKKAIWVSVSNDLKYDSERDLKDIGAKGIDVHFLSKVRWEILYIQ